MHFELGAWVARTQVFAAVAGHCSFAQAECLRKIRESDVHKTLGITWEDFCPRHLGLSRSRVDGIIQNAREFGEPYFKLAEMVPISPETYRRVAPHVADGATIDLGGGQVVELAPENAAAIRSAIAKLRGRCPPQCDYDAEFKSIRRRMRYLFASFATLTPQLRSTLDLGEMRRTFDELRAKFTELHDYLRGRGFPV